MRQLVMTSVAALMIGATAGTAESLSVEKTVYLNIPSQSLSDALVDFSSKTKIAILTKGRDIEFDHLRSGELQGEYSPMEAIQLLLSNHGIPFVFKDQYTLILGEGGEEENWRAKGFRAISYTTAADYEKNLDVYSEEETAEDVNVEFEEIRVTGSYIRGSNTAAANPISVMTEDDMKYSGANDVTDMLNALAGNSGAENRPDTFTSFYSQGTSNVNLRGLGLSSTLVLIDGKRQTISGAKAQDGSTFVDTASIPAIALQRIEVLKEGAAAAYGSDAVAGVVNFITRDDFEGVKAEGSWQTTDEDSQTDINVSLLAGFGNDDTHVVFAGSMLRRSNLNGRERPELVQAAISSLGTSFVMSEDTVVPSGDWAGSYVAGENVGNPKCEGEIQGVVLDRGAGGNRCGFHYGLHYNIVNEEEREQFYTSLTHEFTGDIELTIKGFYSSYRIIDNYTVPAYPILTFPTIPADHPDNPFDIPVTYLGRINPTLDPAQSPKAPRDNKTYRIDTGLTGSFSNGWGWRTSLVYSKNTYVIQQPEMSIMRLNAGLAGNGGPSGTEYINPFDPLQNSLELLDWLKTEFGSSTSTSLLVWDGVVNGELFDMPAGAVNVAVGGQFRREKYQVDPNAESTITPDPVTGINSRADFIFLGGVNEVDESRNASAVFAEMEVPLLERLTMNVAVRFEHLTTENSINPKLAMLYEVTDNLLFRASVSNSFREPSLSQFYADTVSTINVQDYEVDPSGDLVLDGSGAPIPKAGSLFIRRATTGNPDLKPEKATNYNIGAVWSGAALEARLDYWRTDYKDVITIEDAQGKLLADPDGPDIERLDPNDPNSELGGISTNYFNAETINASGVDFEGSYTVDVASGTFKASLGLSHYLNYKIPLNGVITDVSGEFNRGNFARSIPKTKGNISAHWQNDNHSLYARLNYVSSYKNGEDTIDSFETVDLQYQYLFNLGNDEATLTAGIINAFNKKPPFVVDGANFSYDPKQHDPRGRIFYLRASYTF